MSKDTDKILSRKRLENEYILRRSEWRAAGKAAFGTSGDSAARTKYVNAAIAYKKAGEALKAHK